MQMDQEAITIDYIAIYFYKFLIGREYYPTIDHKVLIMIFGSKKGYNKFIEMKRKAHTNKFIVKYNVNNCLQKPQVVDETVVFIK